MPKYLIRTAINKCLRVNLIQTARQHMARVFAISDLHVDIPDNLKWVNSLSESKYKQDVLIVAGDVTDDISLLKHTLQNLKKKFSEVCYVPGNHEMWIRAKKNQSETIYQESLEKFNAIVLLCDNIGVHTKPLKVTHPQHPVWIVPLFSWYTQPEEDLDDTLYVNWETEDKELTKTAWMDNRFCIWDSLADYPAKYFARLNNERLHLSYDCPVISFSHFVPRYDLIPASQKDLDQVHKERCIMGLSSLNKPNGQGANTSFNFSRYAGCKTIDKQIRQLKSTIHIFGHQHRNRDCVIDDVRYISFCLGYPRERSMGLMWGMSEYLGPRQVWPSI